MPPVRPTALLICAVLAGCATLPATGDTPWLPPSTFGIYEDNDTGAINQAAWAFASPGRTAGDPVDAAKAVVAVEYLAGALRSNPRWFSMSAVPKQEMLQARADLRQVLGIAPDAPPQLVVEALLQAAWYLRAGNQPAALQALASPVFGFPPPTTLHLLANLPYVQSANLASIRASNEMFQPEGPRS